MHTMSRRVKIFWRHQAIIPIKAHKEYSSAKVTGARHGSTSCQFITVEIPSDIR